MTRGGSDRPNLGRDLSSTVLPLAEGSRDRARGLAAGQGFLAALR